MAIDDSRPGALQGREIDGFLERQADLDDVVSALAPLRVESTMKEQAVLEGRQGQDIFDDVVPHHDRRGGVSFATIRSSCSWLSLANGNASAENGAADASAWRF